MKNNNDTVSAKKWISVTEISDYCLVSRSTIRRWIKEGKIAAIKLPSQHYRVSVKDFIVFLNKYEIPIKESLSNSGI